MKHLERVYNTIKTATNLKKHIDSVDISIQTGVRADYVMEALSELKKKGRIIKRSYGINNWYETV